MKDLIAKLEAAEAGSRDLDAEMAVAVSFELPSPMGECAARLCLPTPGTPARQGGYWLVQLSGISLRPAPHFSTSIDAALTLVPEGWQWQTSNRAPLPYAGRGYIHNGELHMSVKYRGLEAVAFTSALALCIAALKARDES